MYVKVEMHSLSHFALRCCYELATVPTLTATNSVLVHL